MLLRNRPPSIESLAATPAEGFERVPARAIALMRWLSACGIDYVLVGSVAAAIRGEGAADGPVDIVPAPYGRNLDRLVSALMAVRAQERSHGELIGVPHPGAIPQLKLTPELLVRPERWRLRCGEHELDIEGRTNGSPSYQELLCDAVRFSVADGCSVEVAAPEDIALYDHIRRTGRAPEIKVERLP